MLTHLLKSESFLHPEFMDDNLFSRAVLCAPAIASMFADVADKVFLRAASIVSSAARVKFVQPVAFTAHVAKNPSNAASSVHLE